MSAPDELLALIKPYAAKFGCPISVECAVSTSAPDQPKWRVFIEKTGQRTASQLASFEDAMADSAVQVETAAQMIVRLRKEAADRIAEATQLETDLFAIEPPPGS